MTVICLLVAQVFQMLFLVGKFPQKKTVYAFPKILQCMHVICFSTSLGIKKSCSGNS